jgi:predicted ATP-grasp superfamily ATP-dependent carboligase
MDANAIARAGVSRAAARRVRSAAVSSAVHDDRSSDRGGGSGTRRRARGRGAARPRAIVLGIEHPRGVAVLRSLGRCGIVVVGVERKPDARGLGSRYLERTVMVDDDPTHALAAIEGLAGNGDDLLVPTNDRFLALVSRHWERLADRFVPTVPPWAVLGPLMDKPSCYRLAEAAGLRAPRFFAPNDAAELERVLPALDLEGRRYVLSVRLPGDVPADPRTNRLTTVAGTDVAAVRARCLDVAARVGEFPMIAEIVPGRSDHCVGVTMVVARDGTPVVAYGVRRLQMQLYASDPGFVHPYELGANVYCESVRDDEAIEAATRFVRAARFYGAITVEFRRDSRDGGLTLIKADPRVVRATSLSRALGMDVPRALYDAFTGGGRPAPRPYREGVAWLWPTWFAFTAWDNHNRRRASLGRQLWAVVRNAHRIRAFAYLSLRDARPALPDAAPLARLCREFVRYWIVERLLPPASLRGSAIRAVHRRLPRRRTA